MFCGKCGTNNPDTNKYCSSCGSDLSEDAANKVAAPKSKEWPCVAMLSEFVKSDPGLICIIAGVLLTVIGTFLPWVSARFMSTLGIETSQGAVLCLVAIMMLSAIILVRSGATGSWRIVIMILSLFGLALIFQSLYSLMDSDAPIGDGFWVTLSGVIIMAAGNFFELGRATKS